MVKRLADRERCFPKDRLPRVTIRVPFVDDGETLERCVRAAVFVDYPMCCLQVQVLEERDEIDTEALERLFDQIRFECPGTDIDSVTRHGCGVLENKSSPTGPVPTRGELVASMEAGYVVPKDFLTQTVHCFIDPRLVALRGRAAPSGVSFSRVLRASPAIGPKAERPVPWSIIRSAPVLGDNERFGTSPRVLVQPPLGTQG